jgi:hypothetical protein
MDRRCENNGLRVETENIQSRGAGQIFGRPRRQIRGYQIVENLKFPASSNTGRFSKRVLRIAYQTMTCVVP